VKCKLLFSRSRDGMHRSDCLMSRGPSKENVLLPSRGALPVSILGDLPWRVLMQMRSALLCDHSYTQRQRS